MFETDEKKILSENLGDDLGFEVLKKFVDAIALGGRIHISFLSNDYAEYQDESCFRARTYAEENPTLVDLSNFDHASPYDDDRVDLFEDQGYFSGFDDDDFFEDDEDLLEEDSSYTANKENVWDNLISSIQKIGQGLDQMKAVLESDDVRLTNLKKKYSESPPYKFDIYSDENVEDIYPLSSERLVELWEKIKKHSPEQWKERIDGIISEVNVQIGPKK